MCMQTCMFYSIDRTYLSGAESNSIAAATDENPYFMPFCINTPTLGEQGRGRPCKRTRDQAQNPYI